MDQRRSRVKTISPGIRQKPSGKFIVTKCIKSKRYYEEFDRLPDAKKWKKDFHPLLPNNSSKNRLTLTVSDQSNGKDKSISFGEVVKKYRKGFLASLDSYTQYKKQKRMERFFPNLVALPMCAFNSEIVTDHLASMKLLIDKDSRRCNFDKELKDLSSVLNWYHDNIDSTFNNPVTKVHFRLGRFKEIIPKSKHLDIEQLSEFFSHLKEPFQTLAVVQFLMAGRIQEAAAINDRTVSFKERKIFVTEKMVWLKGNPELKIGTKTGEIGAVDFPKDVERRLLLLKATRPKTCKFLFHSKGKPLRYNLILKKYNEALVSAGLEEFSGTNILRHSMAKIVRKEGGLEACQSILRHTSARMSEHYSKLDANTEVSKVINFASELLRKSQKLATICDQSVISS